MNAILIALAALIALSSCAPTRKACERNYGPCGVIARDTLIQNRVRIDSATVYTTVPIHDTVLVHSTDTVVVRDGSGRVELRKWYDSRLQAYRIACEAKSLDTVVTTRIQYKDRPIPAEGSWRLPWWAVFLLGTIGGLIVRMIVK